MEEVKWMRYFNEFTEDRIRGIIPSLSNVEIPKTQQPAGKDTKEQGVSVPCRTRERLRGWVCMAQEGERSTKLETGVPDREHLPAQGP